MYNYVRCFKHGGFSETRLMSKIVSSFLYFRQTSEKAESLIYSRHWNPIPLAEFRRACYFDGNGSFRPLSRSPWVVSLRVISPSITRVISPSYPESFRPLLNESFRPLSKLIFYWGCCDKFTVFASFDEDFGHISLKNDRSFINWCKWYIYEGW